MAQAAVWIACFALGLAMPQVVRMLLRKKRLPVRVTIDADDPRPRDVARYLAEIAARLDERPALRPFAGERTLSYVCRKTRNRSKPKH